MNAYCGKMAQNLKLSLNRSVIVSVVLIMTLASGLLFADKDRLYERGHHYGQYYFSSSEGLCRTDENGYSYEVISDAHDFREIWVDSRDSCMYSVIITEPLGHPKMLRTFDLWQTWDTISFGPFGGGASWGVLGSESGEIYGNAYPYVRYSNDYGDSYETSGSENYHGSPVTGHSEGQIYSCNDLCFYQSTDYGASFDSIFVWDDSTDYRGGSTVVKPGPVGGEIYFFRPLVFEPGFYLSYSDDYGDSFTRLCRIPVPDVDYDYYEWFWDMTPGYETGEVTIAYSGWTYYMDPPLHWFLVLFTDDYGQSWDEITVVKETNGIRDPGNVKVDPLPQSIDLRSYPNPFNPTVSIDISFPQNARASVSIYDLMGREVERLLQGQVAIGRRTLVWDATGVSAGEYLVRVSAGHGGVPRAQTVEKVVLVK